MMHLRAYSGWRQVECVGSTQFVDDVEKEHGRHDIPEAKAGRDLHELVAQVLDDKVALEDVAGEGSEHVGRCMEFIKRHGYDGGAAEVPFELREGGELVVRCRADYVSQVGDSVVVVDWKFYREPLEKIETEWQMKITICAAAMDRGLNKGFAKLFLPILGLTYEYEVEDVLKTYQSEILPKWELINEKLNLRSGPWCARCPVLGRCPAAAQTMQMVAASANLGKIWASHELPTVNVMTESLYAGLQTMAPAKFRGVLQWLPVVPAFEKAVKRLLREQLTADPSSHPDWELKPKNLPATGDKEQVWDAVEDYLEAREFEECKKLSVAQVKERLIERLVATEKCPTKKAAGHAAETILGPVTERKSITELRRKKL